MLNSQIWILFQILWTEQDGARIPEEQEDEEQYSSIRTFDNLPSYQVPTHNY